jgi:hypothetical protein
MPPDTSVVHKRVTTVPSVRYAALRPTRNAEQFCKRLPASTLLSNNKDVEDTSAEESNARFDALSAFQPLKEGPEDDDDIIGTENILSGSSNGNEEIDAEATTNTDINAKMDMSNKDF